MKGLTVDAGGQLSVQDMPIPAIDDYKALVKLESCGVCNGTDLKLIHGKFKNFSSYPAVLGHEGVGRIVETGKKVTSYKLGDRVLLPFIEGMAGDYHSGWGAFAEYAVVGDAAAMIADGKGPGAVGANGMEYFSEGHFAQQTVPEEINAVNASMIITFREVLSAIKRFGFKENKSVVIFGAGPVGLSFIKFCRLLGVGPVIAFDITDEKAAEALKMGADYAFNSKNTDVRETVRRILPDGADYTVDAVGNNNIINQSMSLIKYNGKICCYGISPKLGMELDWSAAPYNWSLDFVQWPSKLEESQAHRQILAWIASGALDPSDFISDVFDFADILTAFRMVEEGKTKKKIVIRF